MPGSGAPGDGLLAAVAELDRLREHLRRFEAEVTDAMERTLHGSKGLSA